MALDMILMVLLLPGSSMLLVMRNKAYKWVVEHMWDRMCFAAVKLSNECDARRNNSCQLDRACRCVASLV